MLLFYVLVFWPQGMWNPSSLTRDWTRGLPALEGKILTTGPRGKCPPQYILYKNKKQVIRQKNNSIFVKNICVYVLGKDLEAIQQIIVFQESEVDCHYFFSTFLVLVLFELYHSGYTPLIIFKWTIKYVSASAQSVNDTLVSNWNCF